MTATKGTKATALAAMRHKMESWFDVAAEQAVAAGYARTMERRLHARIDREARRGNAALDFAEPSPFGSADDIFAPAVLEASAAAATINDQAKEAKRAASKAIKAKALCKFGRPFKQPGARLQVSAPAGSGKTTLLAGLLKRHPRIARWCVVWILQPDHAKAAEMQADLTAAGVPASVVRGRGAEHPAGGRKMCERHELAKKASQAGVVVATTICPPCPHRGACAQDGYLSQKSDKPGVYVLTHDYLTTPGAPVPRPDLLVVDESHWRKMTRDIELPLEDVTRFFNAGGSAEERARWVGVANALKTCLVAPGGRMLEAVRALLAPTDLDFAHDFLELAREAAMPQIGGDMTDAAMRSLLEDAHGGEHQRARALRRLVGALRLEAVLDRPLANAITFDPAARVKVMTDGEASWEQRPTVRVGFLAEHVVAERVPVLLLDASADIDINRRLWGDRLEDFAVKLDRNAFVTQVSDRTFGRWWAIPTDPERAKARLDELCVFVRQVQAKHGSTLVVTYSGLAEDIAAKAGAMALHFGKLRGQNVAEGCNAVVVLGREEHRGQAEQKARAIYAMDAEPILAMGTDPIKGKDYRQSRGHRMRDGSSAPVEVGVHPDPRAQRVLEQMREREVEQAVDRVRLIHNDTPKAVYLLTSIPVDVTVDRLVPWSELSGDTRFQQAWREKGVLPTGAANLHAVHSALFPSKNAAELALKQDGIRGVFSQLESILGEDPPYAVQFRLKGQPGSPSKAFLDKRRHPDTLVALEWAFGRPVVKVVEEAPAAASISPTPAAAVPPPAPTALSLHIGDDGLRHFEGWLRPSIPMRRLPGAPDLLEPGQMLRSRPAGGGASWPSLPPAYAYVVGNGRCIMGRDDDHNGDRSEATMKTTNHGIFSPAPSPVAKCGTSAEPMAEITLVQIRHKLDMPRAEYRRIANTKFLRRMSGHEREAAILQAMLEASDAAKVRAVVAQLTGM